jgi:hypothetical protein
VGFVKERKEDRKKEAKIKDEERKRILFAIRDWWGWYVTESGTTPTSIGMTLANLQVDPDGFIATINHAMLIQEWKNKRKVDTHSSQEAEEPTPQAFAARKKDENTIEQPAPKTGKEGP